MKIENIKASIEADKKYKTGKIREQNYEVILNAAERIFAENGFKAASMMAIANEAELPKANIHYYFKNKSTLYAAVLERIIKQWNTGLDNISEADDPAEVLSAYIYDKTRLACQQPLPSKLFAREIISGAPYLGDYIKEDMGRWLKSRVAIFESWMDQGKMRKLDAEHLIFMIWATTQHYADFEAQVLLIRNRASYTTDDIEHIANFVCSMLLTGCGLEMPEVIQSRETIEAVEL